MMVNGIEMEFKLIPKKDLRKVWKLQKEYVDEKIKLKEIKELYPKFPELFVGCYYRKKLIGICIPGIQEKELYIKGIAVKYQYWRRGIGSKLLNFFEHQLRALNKKRINVPSADIDWVERFYLNNGYKPILFLVKVKITNLPRDYKKKRYKLLNERIENNYKIFYIKTKKYEPKQKEKIKKMFNADEVIYIMEKKL